MAVAILDYRFHVTAFEPEKCMRGGYVSRICDGADQITIVQVGPVPCGATASYDHHGLAMLARKPGETIKCI